MYCLGLLWVVPMRFEIVGTTAHRWGFKVLTPGLVKAFHDRGVRHIILHVVMTSPNSLLQFCRAELCTCGRYSRVLIEVRLAFVRACVCPDRPLQRHINLHGFAERAGRQGCR